MQSGFETSQHARNRPYGWYHINLLHCYVLAVCSRKWQLCYALWSLKLFRLLHSQAAILHTPLKVIFYKAALFF